MAETFWAQQRANWERPGALVRDPVTGAEWRVRDGHHKFDRGYGAVDALERAISAGPVVDDDATRGILLDWLGRVWVSKARTVDMCLKETSVQRIDIIVLRLGGSALDDHAFLNIHHAIHWMLTSPDSPVREGK